jgi:hypothetical protein
VTGTRVVSSAPKKRSELEHFAMWFHQDWSVFFPTFEEAADAYVRPLSSERKTILRAELTTFLVDHGATRGTLRRQWLKIGAQGGPTNLKDSLRLIIERM